MSGSLPPPLVSRARTVRLPEPDPSLTEELRWDPKSPATSQDYSLDVTPWADDAGETVTSFVASVTASGSTTAPLTLTARPLVAGSNVCTVILSGGASPTDCCVTFLITTATRTLQLGVWILVANLSANTSNAMRVGVIGTTSDTSMSGSLAMLAAEIAAETTRAEAAEAVLTADYGANTAAITSLSASLTAANASFVAFETTIDASLAAEISRAETEEANLQAQITALQASGGGGGGGGTAPSYLLMEDGVSRFILEDGSGFLLLES